MAKARDKELRAKKLQAARETIGALGSKLPPHAPAAEAAVLGSIMIDPRRIGDVVQILPSADAFYRPHHQVIYRTILALHDASPLVELLALQQRLQDEGQLEAIGGLEYLLELANGVPSASHVEQYATEVRDKSMLRELIDAASEAIHDAHTRPHDAQSVVEESESRIFAIAQARETSHARDLRSLLEETIGQIEAADGRSSGGVPSGYDDLDSLLNGLHRGEMIVLAARPSMGKTAMALNIMEQVGATGVGCAMFSLEMSKQQLAQRMLCAKSGVDSQRVRRGQLRAEDFRHLQEACQSLAQQRIWVDDTPGMTLLQLRSKARRLVDQHQVAAIFIDYLQLLTSGSRAESRQVEVSEISRGIKAMARELNLPVVCLSQLNRAVEGRGGNRPRISDLRESGSIEQDADVVMLLHREDYYHIGEDGWREKNENKIDVADLIVAKQRNGPTGTVRLVWNNKTTRFLPLDRRHAPTGVDYAADGDAYAAPAESSFPY
ncbi:MAG: replicative DNA helicase [Planctomycetota bacterium]|nr:replicative DNA helicase [Planctomycetota bacterium]